jgi:hypothetical protein
MYMDRQVALVYYRVAYWSGTPLRGVTYWSGVSFIFVYGSSTGQGSRCGGSITGQGSHIYYIHMYVYISL